MIGGVNLHAVVRGAINSLFPDEEIFIYPSLGSTNVKGIMKAAYDTPFSVMASVQAANSDDLANHNAVAANTSLMRFYLDTESSAKERVDAIYRPLARGGDMIYRPYDETWWHVISVPDRFERVGWECVIGALQVNGIEGVTAP